MEVHAVDDATEQHPVEVSPDIPVDDQTTGVVPVAEDVIAEPTPVEIIEIVPEEPTVVEISETSKPAPEAAPMDVEEAVVLQEADKANDESQEREGMPSSS